MWGWICAGLAVAMLVGWGLARWRLYSRLFADEHLLEVARGVVQLKEAALAKVIEAPEQELRSPEDPRVLRSRLGLALLYTVSHREPGRYVHHASVSLVGGPTAHAVGELFILLWAKVLGVPHEGLTLGVSQATVHHAEFVLDEPGEAEFARRPTHELAPDQVAEFRGETARVRAGLQWGRLRIGPG
jgi:hypothetical protein